MTNSGDLVYLDFTDRTVNMVMETQVYDIKIEWMSLDDVVLSLVTCWLLWLAVIITKQRLYVTVII